MHPYWHKRYRHLSRYREIANVLARHGFGYILHQLGLGELLNLGRRLRVGKGAPVGEQPSPARRLRLVLEELGPTFIKLGQVLSTRADLLPPPYIAELEKLQDQVPPFPFSLVRQCLQAELGLPPEAVFEEFEEHPLAAASLGQVHRARLKDGTPVVVKVQRPEAEKLVATDMEILHDVARLVDRHSPWREVYHFEDFVGEFEKILRREMDFTVEGQNAETFRRHFAGDETVYIPAVYWNYTTRRVLTMEYLMGAKLSDPEALDRMGIRRDLLARRLSRALLRQILQHGFFHGDPHPGNLAALAGNRIAFLDFGVVGRLSEEQRETIGDLVLGIIRRNTAQVLGAIEDLGVIPPHVNRNVLYQDVDALREKYYDIPLSEISLGEALRDIMGVAFKHRIRVPTQFTLLVKSLVVAEGVVAQLDPQLSMVEIARPLGSQLLLRRIGLQKVKRLLHEGLTAYGRLLGRLPRKVDRLLDLAASGGLIVKTVNPELGQVLSQLNAMVNRLVLSILLGSLIVGSSLLLGRGYNTLWGIPVLEGLLLAGGILSLALIFSILRSRRF
ncbi:ABC1 kinase family protein [Desulfovirgula thermocuniculi]|uniref:ABC1 kinase family protein n=1 Tax=Desulfovirgula thermocuniculi TaxID=348842 RepID=UPI0003F86E75|nr:AarF/UbiB family protein [Desulfovirgula thermocuniculi]